MALAANVRQYLPPKRIQQMEADLADLAHVWEDTRFAGPWGWSLATKQRYKQMGVAEECLPSDEWLALLRQLSSREFACRYIKGLLDEMKDPRLIGEEMQWIDKNNLSWGTLDASESTSGTSIDRCRGHRLTDVGDIDLEVVEASQRRIFKSPWSSSGRGVFVATLFDDKTQARLQGFLSSQGGFVMDRFYEDKVLDFAMEFFVNDDRTVDFLGYSVFYAAEHGAYGYNYVESQDELLRRIVGGNDGISGVDKNLLERLIDYHKAHLSSLTSQLGTKNAQHMGWYYGPMGIDMLKTADGHIHPCLEMNFRMNMGILALLLHEKHGSGCTQQLTPHRPNGFEALVERGKLMIAYRRR